MSLFLIPLRRFVALRGREHDDVARSERAFLCGDFHAALTLVHASVVAVDAAEAGVKEYAGLAESQVADAGIEVVERNAVSRLRAAHVGGEEICLVLLAHVGHTVPGIINDKFLAVAIGYRFEPGEFVFEDNLLGGVFANMDVLGGQAKRLLAVLAEHAGIVYSIRYLRHEAVVFVANNEGVGVALHVDIARDNAVYLGGDVVVVGEGVRVAALAIAFDGVFGEAVGVAVARVDLNGQAAHLVVVERVAHLSVHPYFGGEDVAAEGSGGANLNGADAATV